MTRFLLMFALLLSACATQPDSSKLKGHLTQAGATTSQTQTHIGHVRTRLETIDYKAGRAKQLLDKGSPK